jgi:hypothetical protein
MSENKFSPEMGKEAENKKEIKPFLKKVECRADCTCDCGKQFKKGEMINLVLTQSDIDEELAVNPNADPKPSRMCDDCLDEKFVRENEEKEKGA